MISSLHRSSSSLPHLHHFLNQCSLAALKFLSSLLERACGWVHYAHFIQWADGMICPAMGTTGGDPIFGNFAHQNFHIEGANVKRWLVKTHIKIIYISLDPPLIRERKKIFSLIFTVIMETLLRVKFVFKIGLMLSLPLSHFLPNVMI